MRVAILLSIYYSVTTTPTSLAGRSFRQDECDEAVTKLTGIAAGLLYISILSRRLMWREPDFRIVSRKQTSGSATNVHRDKCSPKFIDFTRVSHLCQQGSWSQTDRN
ncbi:uncharacterized protein BP01DRAFT_359495 [Aspergillus saccharolyticus JOP 1030-1]|uniref:Uncharacterized protein n=1 Tax=Aspergillus saccharolyticus JOP 1030-1 TaxID=1450539 RepID=A0A318Z524_9EURO|nr:hypothetical protein BP01DRAFT_359495 [Aspergillus saccharolyticus JOP 1030-1]PYH42411.1 hypothetical protein BP01DRAFT_359495 [Aspergillus saccharolyticus JOP 1030-1]